MENRPNVLANRSGQYLKILVLLVLISMLCLPFVLVKIFSKQPESTVFSPLTPLFPLQMPAKQRSKSTSTAWEKAKTATTPQSPWTRITTRSGDTLGKLFTRAGLNQKLLADILQKNPHAKSLAHLKTGETLQFLIKNKTLEKLIIPSTALDFFVIQRTGTHYQTTIHHHKTTTRNQFITATVTGSLYNTAKRYHVPSRLIQQMTEIFATHINFAKEARSGDRFSLSYNALYSADQQVGTGDILAVSYRSRDNHLYQAVRHTGPGGQVNYYTPLGESLKKAFNRYPVRFSHISSTFSLSRYHPILHYRRPHKGVDLAARLGTPILATADGRIEMIGRQSNGYGNMIKIRHTAQYSSLYGHMLKFQKGLSRGSRVQRGQVIGYVGQSGLASGPHCHYEFHVNNQPRNPTTVSLPQGFPLYGRELAAFKATAGNLLAQLSLHAKSQLALASSHKKT